jgi:signal transduction histidine kinase
MRRPEVHASLTTAEVDGTRARLEHDLRQSLCAMTALLDLIRQAPLSTPALPRRLGQIRRETEWIESVIAEAAPEATTAVDPGEVVTGTWRLVAPAAPCSVRLVCEPVPTVRADAAALGRAVRNLADNAIRAAGPGGAVELRTYARQEQVIIEVADSGPGFGKIRTLHGHGLTMVREALSQCAGRLRIGTAALGGTLMTLEIPRLRDHLDLRPLECHLEVAAR